MDTKKSCGYIHDAVEEITKIKETYEKTGEVKRSILEATVRTAMEAGSYIRENLRLILDDYDRIHRHVLDADISEDERYPKCWRGDRAGIDKAILCLTTCLYDLHRYEQEESMQACISGIYDSIRTIKDGIKEVVDTIGEDLLFYDRIG